MVQNNVRKAAILGLSLALTAGMAGCRVHVDKDANGEEKNVQVDTPFGGVHVNTDQTTGDRPGIARLSGRRHREGRRQA